MHSTDLYAIFAIWSDSHLTLHSAFGARCATELKLAFPRFAWFEVFCRPRLAFLYL